MRGVVAIATLRCSTLGAFGVLAHTVTTHSSHAYIILSDAFLPAFNNLFLHYVYVAFVTFTRTLVRKQYTRKDKYIIVFKLKIGYRKKYNDNQCLEISIMSAILLRRYRI